MPGVDDLDITAEPGGCLLCVKAVPGSSRDRIVGVLGSALKIATAAAPQAGRANKALARTLADALDLKPRDVILREGKTHPAKRFYITGLDPDALRHRLADLLD